MSVARFARPRKRQLGQFFTPAAVARRIVDGLELSDGLRVLEPSFGRGVFLDALLDAAAARGVGLDLHGCEIDKALFAAYRPPPTDARMTLVRSDFFRWTPQAGTGRPPGPAAYRDRDWGYFDLIVGNPPFGGSIDRGLQDRLDAVYGLRHGEKIKKETYSFFVVKSLDLLRPNGRLAFVCSDTFLTINTMRGLRSLLMREADVSVDVLTDAFDETDHPMVVLQAVKRPSADQCVRVNGRCLPYADVRRTANLSWNLAGDTDRYFSGATLGDYLVATSGMTIGNNELFVRDVTDGRIAEPYAFEFFDDPVRVGRERERSRLKTLGPRTLKRLTAIERQGGTRRNVRVVTLSTPLTVRLPHPDYLPYNKASSAVVFEPSRHVVYWADDGDAVLTFKRNGNWYLHGVGGRKFFKRAGLTWALVAPRMHTRYLPAGSILDSGAPCAFPREHVDVDEVYFIMGWTLTDVFNAVLKTTINHTRNIQGKDLERMPYPVWVSAEAKRAVVAHVKGLIDRAEAGERFGHGGPDVRRLDAWFAWSDTQPTGPSVEPPVPTAIP